MTDQKPCPMCSVNWHVPEQYYTGHEAPRAHRQCTCQVPVLSTIMHTDSVVQELLGQVSKLTETVNLLLRLVPDGYPNSVPAQEQKLYGGGDLSQSAEKVPPFIVSALIASGDESYRHGDHKGMDMDYYGCLYCGSVCLSNSQKPAGAIPRSRVTFKTCSRCEMMKIKSPEVMHWITDSLFFLMKSFMPEMVLESQEHRSILV